MGKVDFKLDDAKLKTNLAKFGPQVNKYITLTTDFGGQSGTKQMKLKAPWTDDTTNARNGLHSNVDHSGSGPVGFTKHSITFAHGVDYGIWLELIQSGKFQIIMPTVLAVGKEVMRTLNGMFANMDGTPSVQPSVDLPGGYRRGTSQGVRQRTTPTSRQRNTKTSNSTRRTKRS